MSGCENCEKLEERIAKQRSRITRLAREKSHLQLVADVLSDLAKLNGILPIARHTLQLLMNSIGGTNFSIYFKQEDRWLYLDVFGRQESLPEPNDDDVRSSLVSRCAMHFDSDADTTMPFSMATGQSRFEKWVFPLEVDGEIYGALCADGLLVHPKDAIIEQLGIVTTYISLVLKNESLNESRIKRAYDALKMKNQELENEIDSRIRVEQEKHQLQLQLQQAQKMEAIGTLAGGIAHDFNNLLSAIIGYTDLASDECTESERQHHLGQVMRAADRARELVTQILAFSRKQDVRNAPILIGPVIKEVMKLLRASIPSTISIHVDVDNECPAVYGNATNFHQIIMNLCTNATHAMEETGGQLNVKLSTRTSGNNQSMVQLSITDTGQGIQSEILPRIFEPYFTTKGVGKGTGMGLAVVHGIVHSIGGNIDVLSRQGKGTTIMCEFPAVFDTFRDSEVPEGPSASYSGVAMVVDDEASIAAMAAHMLRRMGFQTDIFLQSHRALEAFYTSPDRYSLVLTDQTMPEMTGLQLSKHILDCRYLPIIISSGYSSSLDEEKLAKLQVSGYIAKPYKFIELEKTVSSAMTSTWQSADVRATDESGESISK
ncbi:MAG: response regulator [Deltaproteobacteria bacterium]|nr:response regulator [Deltaproteobacteria bacterium]